MIFVLMYVCFMYVCMSQLVSPRLRSLVAKVLASITEIIVVNCHCDNLFVFKTYVAFRQAPPATPFAAL
jgi:hypothetical protein